MAQIPYWGCHPWLLRGLWSSATCDMNKSNGEKQADEEMNRFQLLMMTKKTDQSCDIVTGEASSQNKNWRLVSR